MNKARRFHSLLSFFHKDKASSTGKDKDPCCGCSQFEGIAGSVLFSDGEKISEDNDNLYWDSEIKRFGVGTNTPYSPFHLISRDPNQPAVTLGHNTANDFGGAFVLFRNENSSGLDRPVASIRGGSEGPGGKGSLALGVATGTPGPITQLGLLLTGDLNIGINTETPSDFGGGRGIVAISNTFMPPTGEHSEGGLLYSNRGAGTWKGNSGTVTTFGPADPHCKKCGYDFWKQYQVNSKWGAKLLECGWCGHKVKEGPDSVLDQLDPDSKLV